MGDKDKSINGGPTETRTNDGGTLWLEVGNKRETSGRHAQMMVDQHGFKSETMGDRDK